MLARRLYVLCTLITLCFNLPDKGVGIGLDSGHYVFKSYAMDFSGEHKEDIDVTVKGEILTFDCKHASLIGCVRGTKVQLMAMGHIEIFFGELQPDGTVSGFVVQSGQRVQRFVMEKK